MEESGLFWANKRESAVDIVVNNIKQLLVEQKLKPGDRLPNEMEISRGMGVSRGSVREAMKILSAFGLIDIQVGNGTYVSRHPGNTLMDALLFSFLVANPDTKQLYELRYFIEVDILELILRHYPENKPERLALRKNLDALSKMMAGDISLSELSENDIEFHHLLGACTKNELMQRIYSILINFLEPTIRASHRRQKGEITFRAHSRILEVIEAGDREHIDEAIRMSSDIWAAYQNPLSE